MRRSTVVAYATFSDGVPSKWYRTALTRGISRDSRQTGFPQQTRSASPQPTPTTTCETRSIRRMNSGAIVLATASGIDWHALFHTFLTPAIHRPSAGV